AAGGIADLLVCDLSAGHQPDPRQLLLSLPVHHVLLRLGPRRSGPETHSRYRRNGRRGPGHSRAEGGARVAIRGVITGKHVLLNAATIVREFGPRTFLRCCMALALRRPTTFLACVYS